MILNGTQVPVAVRTVCELLYSADFILLSVASGKWREIVEKDCQVRGMNREDAMDRSRWMKQIRDD